MIGAGLVAEKQASALCPIPDVRATVAVGQGNLSHTAYQKAQDIFARLKRGEALPVDVRVGADVVIVGLAMPASARVNRVVKVTECAP